jgi:Cys-tRNA(Pro) deacylase
MPPSTPATQALDALGIPYTLHIHERPPRSLDQAAAERGLLPDQIVRSLLFRLEDGSFILLLMPGPGRVSWSRLRRHLGVTRLTTATAEEVRRITGFEPGAVSPFGLARPLRLLADRAILRYETLSLGAGIRNAGILLSRDDLLRALEPELADLGEETAP